MSLLTTLGLQGPSALSAPPSMATTYIIIHFLFAYGVLSSRAPKRIYGIDHQVSPREDLAKYGPAALKAGKITQAQLDQLKRIESCHANSVEHFPLFVGAMLFATVAGLPAVQVNMAGLMYTVARVVYSLSYVFMSSETTSLLRGVMWWASNIVCLRMYWLAGKAINAGV